MSGPRAFTVCFRRKPVLPVPPSGPLEGGGWGLLSLGFSTTDNPRRNWGGPGGTDMDAALAKWGGGGDFFPFFLFFSEPIFWEGHATENQYCFAFCLLAVIQHLPPGIHDFFAKQ